MLKCSFCSADLQFLSDRVDSVGRKKKYENKNTVYDRCKCISVKAFRCFEVDKMAKHGY